MTSRQRRMWVLPAPTGALDKSDRYEIGIFYSFKFDILILTRYPRVTFVAAKPREIFISEENRNIFVSSRKRRESN